MKRKKYEVFTYEAVEAKTLDDLKRLTKENCKAIVLMKDGNKANIKVYNDTAKTARKTARGVVYTVGGLIASTFTLNPIPAVVALYGMGKTAKNGIKLGTGILKNYTDEEYGSFYLLIHKDVDTTLDTVMFNGEKIL